VAGSDPTAGATSYPPASARVARRVAGRIPGTLASAAEKRDGYLQALTEAGIDYDPALEVDPQGHNVERGYWATETMMEAPRRPTAIFGGNDSLALGALRWALKHNLRVPEDLAIVGMDNIQYAEYAAVPLTTVNYAAETVTRMAVDRLMRLIAAGDQLPEPRVTQIDPDLVVRESTLPRR